MMSTFFSISGKSFLNSMTVITTNRKWKHTGTCYFSLPISACPTYSLFAVCTLYPLLFFASSLNVSMSAMYVIVRGNLLTQASGNDFLGVRDGFIKTGFGNESKMKLSFSSLNLGAPYLVLYKGNLIHRTVR